MVAAQAAHGYISAMRWKIFLPVLLLSACSLPGRQTLAPAPAGPDTQAIAASDAFANRIPLVTILPGTTDFAAPLANAVAQAKAIKPDVRFDVEAQTPVAATPDVGATNLQALSGTASAVAKAIAADGIAPQNISLTAKTAGTDAAILVYVK